MTGADDHKASVSDRAKALLADPLKGIELDDFINGQLRTALTALSLEHFPPTGTINKIKAKCLGGLEVDDQAQFCGLHHRQVGGFFAFENPAGVDAGLTRRGSATVGERWPFACSASMNSVALKAPSGVLLHPPTQGPRGILEPRSAGARTMPWAGFSLPRRERG